MIKTHLVKKNDLMAIVTYVNVEHVNGKGEEIVVKDVDRGNSFMIRGKDLVERCLSADQFEKTEKLTKTELAEKLISSHNRPFTVCFEKVDGSERVLRGRLVSAEPLLGRSHCEDLDITSGTPLRLVDHRTLQWLIVDGVKYIVKK